LHDLPFVFADHPDEGFELFNKISVRWNVPFSSVRATGSAQLGYSYYKGKDFIAGKSDLDISLINPSLFQQFSEFCYVLTNRYSDRTKFGGAGGLKPNEQANAFLEYLAKGYFRPDYMPTCPKKTGWDEFFGRLATEYYPIFKFQTITAGIYLTEGFFEQKQASLVAEFEKRKL